MVEKKRVKDIKFLGADISDQESATQSPLPDSISSQNEYNLSGDIELKILDDRCEIAMTTGSLFAGDLRTRRWVAPNVPSEKCFAEIERAQEARYKGHFDTPDVCIDLSNIQLAAAPQRERTPKGTQPMAQPPSALKA